MPVRRAITFGQKYRREPHPVLGELGHPDGYIVVEVRDLDQFYEFLALVCGREVREDRTGVDRLGAILYAFDYDLEEFELPGNQADTYYPRGRSAEFSTYPLHANGASLRD